jgi:ATP-dependent Clp endopeptidase proteolytic subunit ClpP
MRDVPGLKPLLDRAAARAEVGPQYRFHGHRSPANRTRTPVLDSVPSTKVKDGVATLRIYEPIDSWGGPWGISALEFLDALDSLDESAVEEIQLQINSPGGEVWEAMAILNNLRQFNAKVTARVDGIAASAASFIACAADETIMSPNSQLMIHDAWGICIGNAEDMHGLGDLLDQISDNVASIYATKAGGSTEDWRATMKTEGWYLAEEAVEAGLADRVDGDAAEDPEDAFDLKGIGAKHKGRSEAPPPQLPTRPAAPAQDAAPVPDERRERFNARASRDRQKRHERRTSAA